MKGDTHLSYDPGRTALAESALLTVWPGLGAWREDLVLVGGLAPRYLCHPGETRAWPQPATTDVDLGIALAAESDQYGSLRAELSGQGFRPNHEHIGRFEKVAGGVVVPVDFLVEKAPLHGGTAQVADITANIMPGINRALATAREVHIDGRDLHGARQSITVRVCEAGPFLALKLRAFSRRQQPKDAFDFLYTVLNCDHGCDAAIKAFAEEVRQANPACPDALATLREHFSEEDLPGPAKASHFVLGPAGAGESEDTRFQRQRIRQQAVDAAQRLLRAAAEVSRG